MSRYALHRKPENPLLDVLVERRKSLGISRRDLSKLLRRHENNIHRWEVGKAEPLLRNLEIWCDSLGLELKAVPKSENKPDDVK